MGRSLGTSLPGNGNGIGIVLGDTEYQVSILPIPGSGMVVSNTEIDIVRYQILPMAMWPGSIFAFLQHLSHRNTWFS